MTDTRRADPVVTLAQGRVRGRWRGGSAAFLGVPFAEPPVGELRWAAPVPAAGWSGVWDATQFGATPQRRGFGAVTAIPEPSYPGDATLNVNIFTPAPGDAGARLPVLVWVHGGGFKAGSPNSPWYDGRSFNRDGVVTVSVSYRLGFDGFGVIDGRPDNRGLRDQIAALEWVRDNIAAFGGDPRRVTVGGQSAGGFSVLALLASPLAAGLAHAGIAQSGLLRARPLAEGRARTTELARRAGVEPTAAGLAALREGTMLDLAEAMDDAPQPPLAPAAMVDSFLDQEPVSLAFVPVIGDEVLPGPIADALAAGRGAVPLLIGSTLHEFDFLGGFLAGALGEADAGDVLRATRLAPLADAVLGEVPDLPGGYALAHVNTMAAFRTAVVRAAAAHRGPTWVYDFRHRGVQPDGSPGLAGHCSELPFSFDCLDVSPGYVAAACGVRPPAALAERMHGDWVRFVTAHEAGWAPWRPGGEVMAYAEESAVGRGYATEERLVALLDGAAL